MRTILNTLTLAAALVAASLGAPSAGVAQDATASVRPALERVEDALAADDLAGAGSAAHEAYEAFEEAEAALAARDHDAIEALEAAFDELRAAIAAGDRAEALEAAAEIEAGLDRVGGGAGTPIAAWAAFLQSFGIILREGIEALLLVTVLVAATVKSGRPEGARAVWRGAGAAILASLATAVLVDRVLHVTPAGREAIEGITMVLAAIVLFYVSYWLLSKVEVARWMGYLQDRVEGSRSVWALAGVAFLAVYREGAETVLFYQALGGMAEPFPLGAGFVAGAALLVAIGVAVVRFGLRLPLKPLFAITGSFLYAMAFVFAGQGVHELQEAGWVATTRIGGPRIGALGIYPTLETMLAQGVLVALAAVAAIAILKRRPAPPPAVDPSPEIEPAGRVVAPDREV